MKVHELKLKQPFFDDVYYNRKGFEVRKNDRDYKKGDRLKLVEFVDGKKTPKYVFKDVVYILQGGQYGIIEGFVVLGLKESEISNRFPPLSNTISNSIKADIALDNLKSKLRE